MIITVILYFSREVLCNWDKILVFFSALPKIIWLLGPYDCKNTVLVIVQCDLSLRCILVLGGVAVEFQMSNFIQTNLHADKCTVDLFTMSRYMSVQSGGFRCGPFLMKSALGFVKEKNQTVQMCQCLVISFLVYFFFKSTPVFSLLLYLKNPPLF